MSTLSQFFNIGQSPIKSIQRNTATLPGVGLNTLRTSNTVTLTEINSNKSVLSFSTRYTSGLSPADPTSILISGTILSNTQIKFERSSSAIDDAVTIEWQVTEFN